MTKDEAINIVQTFLDKSSHAKWKIVQGATGELNREVQTFTE